MAYNQNNTSLPTFLVYPKRKSSDNPTADLYIQFSYQLNKINKCLGIKIEFKQWDHLTHSIIGQPMHNQLLYQKVEEYKQKVMGAYYMLVQNGGEVTLREIVDMAFGKEGGKIYSLFSVFGDLILKMEKMIQPGKSRANLIKHRSCLNHLKNFVRQHHRSNEMPFSRINRQFIDDFESYLKFEGGNTHNSANKMLQIFKKVYRIAVDNRWTAHNAFAGRRLTYKKVAKPFLSSAELKTIMDYEFSCDRLSRVRDCFVFSCYTGLAYIDIYTLRREHIEYNAANGQYFIRKNREKTGVESIIPLFKPAREILDRYTPEWIKSPSETTLLPVISNQRYNAYLKQVAAFCGLQKLLSSHVGRHSFATTVTLENGVSIESVSKMLGHSKLSQTQQYAKVTEMKIEKDTRDLFALLDK
ncbi:MAG: site-specific integrase [Chitinophagaceae bacterium]|nr:site-specific integrase [Chitinophagaceae bacterium]